MVNDDLQELMSARKVLTELRQSVIKGIAAGYQRGETETASKTLIDIQQAIEVIDIAIDELDDSELEEADDED